MLLFLGSWLELGTLESSAPLVIMTRGNNRAPPGKHGFQFIPKKTRKHIHKFYFAAVVLCVVRVSRVLHP